MNAVSLAIALYGFAAWVYVAAVALVLPDTLSWQLTHLAPWPRTDTFGECSFVVSFVAFIVYRLTRPHTTVDEGDRSASDAGDRS